MTVEPIPPKFTRPAARIWNAITADDQQILVSSAWCSKCRQEVTVSDYSGSVKAGNIVLVGTCSQCGGIASRYVEVQRNADKSMTVVLGAPKLTSDEALIESKLVMKESSSQIKRLRQLSRKEMDGSITKAEQKELSKMSPKGMNEMLSKMMIATLRFNDVADR